MASWSSIAFKASCPKWGYNTQPMTTLYINIAKCILVVDESTTSISLAILKEFKHCRDLLLTQLRNAAVKLFPQYPDLLELIPEPTRHSYQSNDCVWDDKQWICLYLNYLIPNVNTNEPSPKTKWWPQNAIPIFINNLFFSALSGTLGSSLIHFHWLFVRSLQ